MEKKIMERRTQEIIKVCKGHMDNLFEGTPIEDDGIYRAKLNMFLSDDCIVPYEDLVKDPTIVDGVVKSAVLDLINCVQSPRAFLYDYFESKRLFGDHMDTYAKKMLGIHMDDTACWCAAMADLQVLDDEGQYINGFTDVMHKEYVRQHPFISDTTVVKKDGLCAWTYEEKSFLTRSATLERGASSFKVTEIYDWKTNRWIEIRAERRTS